MSRLRFLAFAFLAFALHSSAQHAPLMTFYRGYVFADRAKLDYNSTNANGPYSAENTGFAPGIHFTVAPPYRWDFDPAVDHIRLGYLISGQVGYGKSGNGNHWIPYIFDIGMWGSYYAGPLLEAGMQYSPIGVYGYSSYAFFGSNLTLKLRIWNLQAEYGREGDGIVRGCFKPRFDSPAIQHFGFYFNHNALFAGVRFINVVLNEDPRYYKKMHELRFVVGFSFDS